MSKKRGTSGQITIFMIIGIIILFAAVFFIMLTKSITQKQLDEQQERVQSKAFYKEGLRLFVEDCLEDELSNAIVLLGKQGRIWKDQGGTLDYTPEKGIALAENGAEAETGVETGNRVFYGITKEEYPKFDNAYPCNNDENDPAFCGYSYPDTVVGFGKKQVLTTQNVEDDLEKYLAVRTLMCAENFIQTNISSKAMIETSELSMNINLRDEGLAVKVDYPLSFSVGGQEFFSLSTFDFFYPTDLNKLIQKAVIFPLKWDQAFVDFAYDENILLEDEFIYAKNSTGTLCESFNDEYFYCTRAVSPYTDKLPIEMEKLQLAGGVDLFTFKYPLFDIVQSTPDLFPVKDFELRVARQNRPPALDYVSRAGCPKDSYDYLVLRDHDEMGSIDINLSALDPDEDLVDFNFPEYYPFVPNIVDNELSVPKELLSLFPPNTYEIIANATDEHGFSDWQNVRILVDRNITVNVSLWMPYQLEREGLLVPYQDIFSKEEWFVASIEDPVFVKVNVPSSSLADLVESTASLSYIANNEDDFSFIMPEQILTVDNTGGCFSLPWLLSNKCDIESYKTESLIDDWQFLQANPSQVNPNAKDFNFFKQTTEGVGMLKVDYAVNYCNQHEETSSSSAKVKVVSCLPHRNPEHPFAYPNHEVIFDELTGTYSTDEINPFLATHSCCEVDSTLSDENKECFVDPSPGCYGRVKDYTILINPKKNQPEGYEGYVKETQRRFCDGKRGNVCGGDTVFELLEEELVCGNSSLVGCNKVPAPCQNQDAYGYSDSNGDGVNDIWCYGDFGCSKFCKSSSVVDVLGITNPTTKFNMNTYAEENMGVLSSDYMGFECGCNIDDEAKSCDANLDGYFSEVCRGGKCVNEG